MIILPEVLDQLDGNGGASCAASGAEHLAVAALAELTDNLVPIENRLPDRRQAQGIHWSALQKQLNVCVQRKLRSVDVTRDRVYGEHLAARRLRTDHGGLIRRINGVLGLVRVNVPVAWGSALRNNDVLLRHINILVGGRCLVLLFRCADELSQRKLDDRREKHVTELWRLDGGLQAKTHRYFGGTLDLWVVYD